MQSSIISALAGGESRLPLANGLHRLKMLTLSYIMWWTCGHVNTQHMTFCLSSVFRALSAALLLPLCCTRTFLGATIIFISL